MMNIDVDSRSSRQAADARGLPRPIILMTPDITGAGNAETEREYAVRANYAEAITQAGGIPLILPYDLNNLASALALADGILITGARPGAQADPERREFEEVLVDAALEAGRPLLGICHGMQLIGERLGGEFVPGLPAQGDETIDHMPRDIPDMLAHEITLETGSELSHGLGETSARVNSLHRHALTGEGRYRVVARASDGVIEAFTGTTKGFCFGVQWHPEYRLTPLDRQVLRTFVERSAEAAASRTTGTRRPASSVRHLLSGMGLSLPQASSPPGPFCGGVLVGNFITISGQVPLKDNAVLKTGRLGADVSLEDGRECARWALLNALAQLERVAGSFDHVAGFIRLAGYIAAGPDFTQHGSILDGASQLLCELFPDRPAHARLAIGVSSLPRGVPVEIELTAYLKGDH